LRRRQRPAGRQKKPTRLPIKPPPLPLHQIEGNGGIFSTLSAYLVNPPRDGEPIGRPAAGFAYVNLGHGQNLEALTLTETPWKRLELGFGYESFDLGGLADRHCPRERPLDQQFIDVVQCQRAAAIA
jgi:hypothetical protein